MSAFDAALAVLHADPNLSAEALFREGGAGEGVPVRAIRSAPDLNADIGGVLVKRGDWRISVRAADVPTVRRNDTIQIGDEVFTVLTAEIDAERISWTLEVRR